MLKVSLMVLMILQLQYYTVMRCRLIHIAKTEVKMPKTHNVPRCIGGKSNVSNSDRDEGIPTVYPPGGTGRFRDPLQVLGALFPTSKSINICEILITLQADVASHVAFSERGRRVCLDVCRQYKKNMITNGPVIVALSQNYCDYSNSGDTIEKTDLATTCNCAYRVTCNNRVSMVFYSFEANCRGFLKVTMSEPNKPRPIT